MGPPDARHWQFLRRHDADPPSRGRGRRLSKIIRLGLSPPSPDRERHCPCFLGRQLQPAGTDHRKADEFADDSAKAAEGQALLHIGEHVLFLVGFDKYHPVGMNADLSERRKKQVRSRQAPNDRALGARGDTGHTKGRRCPIDSPCSAARKFMQGTERQPASWQNRIDLRHAERHRASRPCGTSFKR